MYGVGVFRPNLDHNEEFMNLNHVISLYEIIKSRLPKTYPRPKLAFFEDEQCMMENTGVTKDGDDENVYAVITPQTETILRRVFPDGK